MVSSVTFRLCLLAVLAIPMFAAEDGRDQCSQLHSCAQPAQAPALLQGLPPHSSVLSAESLKEEPAEDALLQEDVEEENSVDSQNGLSERVNG